MIKQIIWDWNGTLFDDVNCCISSMNDLLNEYNLPNLKNISDYHEKFCFPISDYYKKLGFDLMEYDFAVLAKKYMRIYQPRSLRCNLKSSCIDLLKHFRSKKYHQIIISASEQSNLEEQCKQFKIEKYINKAIGLSDELAASKIKLAKSYFEENNIKSSEAIFIGDTLHDYEVAHELDSKCILVNDGHQNNQNKIIKNCYIVQKMEDVTKAMMKIEKESA